MRKNKGVLMSYNFSSDSTLLAGLVLMVITILPVKLGAVLFHAGNSNLINCIISVVAGTIGTFICFSILDGFLALLSAYIVVSLIYWKVLQLSFSWSFIFTFGVLGIQVAIFQALIKAAEFSVT